MAGCEWPILVDKQKKEMCGRLTNLMRVKGKGKYVGRPRESIVCRAHLQEALGAWPGWEEASEAPPGA